MTEIETYMYVPLIN